MTVDRCRSCDAPVWWGRVRGSGKLMPVDVDPHPDGNIEITDAGLVIRPAGELTLFGDGARYRSHFTTCPDADGWRGQ